MDSSEDASSLASALAASLLPAVLYLWMVAMTIGVIAGAAGTKALAWPLGGLGGLALRRPGQRPGVHATISPRGISASSTGSMRRWWVRHLSSAHWCGVLVVTVVGLPREVALGALIVFLVAARVVLQDVDDSPGIGGTRNSGADAATR